MKWGWLLACVSLPASAASSLPPNEASVLLQRIAEAPRHINYEGVFVSQHGDTMQSLFVSNHPVGNDKRSRLMALDGEQREVRCTQDGALNMVSKSGQLSAEKRLSARHFPDLLPANAAALANWYSVKLGEMARVAGLDCQQLELTPKDVYRWGYLLCIEKLSSMPIRAVMLNAQGQPLMQTAFTNLKLGGAPDIPAATMLAAAEAAKPVTTDSVEIKALPPGFVRITAVKRHLPNHSGEVEHWVFSDGLTYISLFMEPATHPVETVKGQSKHGMMNLLTRQVGNFQATVLGDAPWPAIEVVATNLEARR